MWGMETFGRRFRKAREAAGLTQADIATVCNTDKQSVSNWERDENWPTTDNLIAALKKIGRKDADANYILGLSDNNEIPLRFDLDQLADAIASVDHLLQRRKRKQPPPNEYARLIMGLYHGIPIGAELPSATVVKLNSVGKIEGGHGKDKGAKANHERRNKGDRQNGPKKKKV